MAVVDKSSLEANVKNSIYPHSLYSTTQVTSYIIPFVGPHECPNSKKCPNKLTSKRNSGLGQEAFKNEERTKDHQNNEAAAAGGGGVNDEEEVNKKLEELQIDDKAEEDESLVVVPAEGNMDVFSHDVPAEMLASSAPQNLVTDDKTGNSQLPVMNMSFMASNTCPYPITVVWWRTLEGVNRAVIGYSDGSICFVGLSPNCPFVASTSVESGSVVKLLICRDNTFDSVMLLVGLTKSLLYINPPCLITYF